MVSLYPSYGRWRRTQYQPQVLKSKEVISNFFIDEVSGFFAAKNQKVSFLSLFEFFEQYRKKVDFSHDELMADLKTYFLHCFHNFPCLLPDLNRAESFSGYFERFCRKIRKRYLSGILVLNERNELLTVINRDGKLSLPKGHESHVDRGKTRATAVREAKEECNLKLSKKEKSRDRLKKIQFIRYGKKKLNLYQIHIKNYNRSANRININFAQENETRGMRWLPIESVVKKEFILNRYDGKELTKLLLHVLEYHFQVLKSLE